MIFDRHALDIDPRAESDRICSALAQSVGGVLRRAGAVVGISGGVDSSVVLSLCARAFDRGHIQAVIMPERDSDPESERLARLVAERCGVDPQREDISPCLAGLGCYRRKDEAIRQVFPEYDAALGYRSTITLPPNLLEADTLNVFSLTIVRPDGTSATKLLRAREFRQIMAASNLKQRARMAMLYYHAERNHFAVVGTANKDEHDLGFFVKYGDGGVDVSPIAHLYKTQVYQLAEFLGVPEEVRRRPPTTDTYSAPTTQQDFFFRLPFDLLDLLWFAMEHGVPAQQTASALDLSPLQVERAYADFARKMRTTEYLRRPPAMIGRLESTKPDASRSFATSIVNEDL